MKVLKSEVKLCLSCMEEHKVDIVEVMEHEVFKGVEVDFPAIYEHCSNSDEYLANEDMIRANNLAVKDAYREKVGLLTSKEIIGLREKYGVSQKDLSEILDWGGATITRYENHQVQDRAHDDILRKIDSDPRWFLELLKRAKDKLPQKTFEKYYQSACAQYNKQKNQYIIAFIQALYAKFEGEDKTGTVELDLDKVVEVINYFAQNVSTLYKVKLMKLLWYADILHYKRYGRSITGLAYSALPMGAVPEGHEQIVMLDGVSFDTVMYGDNVAYKFKPTPGFKIKRLTANELETLDKVISEFGHLNTDQIVDRMHKEEAYKCTEGNSIILYSFADQLSIE
ncbi:MAG: DUF4065 domain-containing protein [Turneriella sp.]|nr:DUF4065 domain-containing protein [Turneriella sp.]